MPDLKGGRPRHRGHFGLPEEELGHSSHSVGVAVGSVGRLLSLFFSFYTESLVFVSIISLPWVRFLIHSGSQFAFALLKW